MNKTVFFIFLQWELGQIKNGIAENSLCCPIRWFLGVSINIYALNIFSMYDEPLL